MKTFKRVVDVLKTDIATGKSVNAIVKKTGINIETMWINGANHELFGHDLTDAIGFK